MTSNYTSKTNTDFKKRVSDIFYDWSHISPTLLNNWINNESNRNILIIDSRTVHEYNQMHIKNSINLINSKTIRKRLKSNKISIEDLLLRSPKCPLIDKCHFKIVVYDNNSENSKELNPKNSFAYILLQKFSINYDSVFLLIGGFKNFFSKFQKSCESTKIESNLLSLNFSSNNYNRNLLNSYKSTFLNEEDTNDQDEILDSQCKSNIPKKLYIDRAEIIKFDTEDKEKDKKELKTPTKILDFLYLGSQEDALSQIKLKELCITNILNVSVTCPKPDFINEANFLRIPVNDGHSAKILPFFELAYQFIEKCRKSNSKVLIHCLAGISRSPTLAIAYLMKHLHLNSEQAYKFVKEKRTTISPNFNFLGQLYEYELKQEQIKKNEIDEFHRSFSLKSNDILSKQSNVIPDEKNLSKQKTDLNFHLKDTDLNILNLKKKKKFIFNFSDSDDPVISLKDLSPPISFGESLTTNFSKKIFLDPLSTDNLLSPSQAFSNFNLNSPTNNQVRSAILKNSNISDSLNSDFEKKTPTQTNDIMVLSCKNNDSHNTNIISSASVNTNIDLKLKPINSLKRPSSILLNQRKDACYIGSSTSIDKTITLTNEKNCREVNSELNNFNFLSRTISNTSSSSTSSFCSFASLSSNFSNTLTNSTNSDLNEDVQHKIDDINIFNQQTISLKKKVKFSSKEGAN